MYIFKEVKFSSKGFLLSNFAKIYGMGYSKSSHLLEKFGFSRVASVKALNLYKFNALVFFLKRFYMTDSNLKHSVYSNIQDKVNIGSYSGFRHAASLPVRGQRTHTNAKVSRRRKIEKVKI